MTWQHNPRPIATLTPETDRSYLLFCPDQGGWHTGEWWTIDEPVGRWIPVISDELTLYPSHWDDVPPDPIDEGERIRWIAGRQMPTEGSA